MKSLRTAVLCAGIALCSISSFAQEKTAPVNEPNLNKPRLFSNLPERIQLSAEDISGLFSNPVGRSTQLRLSADQPLQFEGAVVSSASMDDNRIQTVVVRSTNYNGANLTISRVLGSDGQVRYRGRIISFAHGDLFELENQGGQYVLVKKNFHDLVNE